MPVQPTQWKEALPDVFRDNDRARVLVVDHEVDRRWWLRETLEEEPERYVCVGEAEDAEKAVWWAHWVRPDVVVMHEDLPDADGMETLERLRRALPEAHLVMHCDRVDETTVDAARRAGADACIEKGGPRIAFRRALHEVLEGPVAAVSRGRVQVFR